MVGDRLLFGVVPPNGATRGWPGVATAHPINLLATPLATPFASPINCNSVSVSTPIPPPPRRTLRSHRTAHPSPRRTLRSHRIAPPTPPVGHFDRPPLNACRPLPGHPTKKSLEAPLVPPAEGDSDLAEDPTEGTIILIYLTNFLIPASRA